MSTMILKTTALAFAAVVTAQPLVNEDVLEPSVRNEVDHALAVAPAEVWAVVTNRPAALSDGKSPVGATVAIRPEAPLPTDVFGTNGLSRTDIALKLVSAQRSDGRWRIGTNDVSVAALRILTAL